MASSFFWKGSKECLKKKAVLMVKSMKKAAGRVKSPRATKEPPKASERAAPQEKITGAGKPRSPTPLMKPSEGGSLPRPWAVAREIPATNLRKRSPRFPGVVEISAPPKRMDFNFMVSLP